MHDYCIKAGKKKKKKTCIRSLITIRDTFPTMQTSNEIWNLSATTIASSIDSLPETDNEVFNAMVVTNVIIGRVTQVSVKLTCFRNMTLRYQPCDIKVSILENLWFADI